MRMELALLAMTVSLSQIVRHVIRPSDVRNVRQAIVWLMQLNVKLSVEMGFG